MKHKVKSEDSWLRGGWFGCSPRLLLPLDRAASNKYLAQLLQAAKAEKLFRLENLLGSKSEIVNFIAAVLDLSPFLREKLLTRPQLLDHLFETSALQRIEKLTNDIAQLGRILTSEQGLMAKLRQDKSEVHVLIALCDLAGVLGAEKTTQRVSQLAIACTNAAVDFILLQAAKSGKLKVADLETPSYRSGWIILGLGKLGANELNYSSDIDLIVLFDPAVNSLPDPADGIEIFSRLTRQLVRILHDRTEDGYVFRTDLRLRPDPGSTPVAIPVEMALNYYEGRGQNWERAALIKATPIAGDIAAGNQFKNELNPFIWRKYLDYAAIADVHSIKRQIHAHKGLGEVAVLGHNVKLGRGGIREIEFFVQTQQLIAGGRDPSLRGAETIEMLQALEQAGWIAGETSANLASDYWFLRDVEHRIQMVHDEQTHSLPEDELNLLRIARMAGFKTISDFSVRLSASLKSVERHYVALFETAPELSAGVGNLVFTGDHDDPETLQTLARLGFMRPSDMCRVLRTWHFGRYRATQSSEARERLTELTPALLKAFGSTADPDDTLLQFDAFLQGLPGGIQLFSLLQSNVALLDLVVLIMDVAPNLADIITRRPHVFDGLLDPEIYTSTPSLGYLTRRIDSFMTGITGYEENLDRLRIFNSEQKFLIGVRLLTGALNPYIAGQAFSNLADLVLQRTFELVQSEFEIKHGRVNGGKVALLGLGKLGSQELTATSDIDLIVLYDYAEGTQESNGERPLHPSLYYGRLTQRLIAAVSAPTTEGILYELDLRLRPSGNKGPVATRLSAFEYYQKTQAWTWEHMALTRARVLSADQTFKTEIESVIHAVLDTQTEYKKVCADASEMRSLIETEKPHRGNWDLKLRPGGLIDLEFIAQVAVITNQIDKCHLQTTLEILQSIKLERITADEQAALVTAYQLFSSLTQVLRLCLSSEPNDEALSETLIGILCDVSGLPDSVTLEAHVNDMASRVRAIFKRLVSG